MCLINVASVQQRFTDNSSNVANLERSIVSLVASENSSNNGSENRRRRVYCTGFFISQRLIATAAHCARSTIVIPGIGMMHARPEIGTEIKYVTFQQQEEERINTRNIDAGIGDMQLDIPNTIPRVSRVLFLDIENDVAVLKIAANEPSSQNFLNISTRDRNLRLGQIVYTMGNPGGLERIFSSGIISRLILNNENGLEGIMATAPIFFGNSGGPLVNESGEVIGVTSAILLRQTHLGMYVPARFLRILLSP
jgi:S1-C subfamily serine protease